MFILLLLIVTIIPGFESEEVFPKKIWAYWAQAFSSMRPFAQACALKLQNIVEPQGYEFILLNDNNLFQFINKTDFDNLYSHSHSALVQHKSDLIRLMVLEAHGGIWLDTTTILLENLNWLQNLNNISTPIRKNGQYPPQVFLFHTSIFNPDSQYQKYRSQGQIVDQKGLIVDSEQSQFYAYENWFIAAQKNSRLIKQWKEKYARYLNMNERLMKEEWLQSEIYNNKFYNRYYMEHNAIQAVLMEEQLRLDRQRGLFDDRVSAEESFRVWSMNSDVGPLKQRLTRLNEWCQLEYGFKSLLMKTKGALDEELGGPSRYFIKFVGPQHERLSLLFDHKLTYEELRDQFLDFNSIERTYDRYPCYRSLFVLEGSYLEQFLLKDFMPRDQSSKSEGSWNQIKSSLYVNPEIKTVTQSQIDKQCDYTALKNLIDEAEAYELSRWYSQPVPPKPESPRNKIYFCILALIITVVAYNLKEVEET